MQRRMHPKQFVLRADGRQFMPIWTILVWRYQFMQAYQRYVLPVFLEREQLPLRPVLVQWGMRGEYDVV
jgi:hypothetical protein